MIVAAVQGKAMPRSRRPKPESEHSDEDSSREPIRLTPRPGSTLSAQTDTEDLVTQFVSLWVQAPQGIEITNEHIFDNLCRRVADRGSVIYFTHFNDELFFGMASTEQAHRVFARINNVWVLDRVAFIRCRGPT